MQIQAPAQKPASEWTLTRNPNGQIYFRNVSLADEMFNNGLMSKDLQFGFSSRQKWALGPRFCSNYSNSCFVFT